MPFVARHGHDLGSSLARWNVVLPPFAVLLVLFAVGNPACLSTGTVVFLLSCPAPAGRIEGKGSQHSADCVTQRFSATLTTRNDPRDAPYTG